MGLKEILDMVRGASLDEEMKEKLTEEIMKLAKEKKAAKTKVAAEIKVIPKTKESAEAIIDSVADDIASSLLVDDKFHKRYKENPQVVIKEIIKSKKLW